jgi:signal transduction histidine kinase
MCNPTQCRYLAQASHLVVSLAANGTIRGASPDVAKTLGHDAASLSRKPFANLVAPDHRPRLRRTLERCRADQAAWEELVVIDSSGRRQALLCCFQRLAAPGDRGALLVTGLRLEEFADGGQMAAAAALGHLTFRCHSPAHRLMQAVEAILMQYPWCEAAERCRSELDRLLEVISQSVNLPPDGAGRAVDVVRAIETALRLVDGDPAYEGLEIVLRPERASAWTSVHPVGLIFVTLHLVRNARDATVGRKAARLLIDILPSDGAVVVEFKDNGEGLDRQGLSSALAPFFKAGCDSDGHTGLGLATCSELVGQMGGKIRIQSVPSKGTTVVVTLPSAPPPK